MLFYLLLMFIHRNDLFSGLKVLFPPTLSFKSGPDSGLQRGSFFAAVGTNIILRDPRDYVGEIQYARFLGPVVACKNINQCGREIWTLGENKSLLKEQY